MLNYIPPLQPLPQRPPQSRLRPRLQQRLSSHVSSHTSLTTYSIPFSLSFAQRERSEESWQNLDGGSQPYKSNDVNSGNRLGRAPSSNLCHFYRQLVPFFSTCATFGKACRLRLWKKENNEQTSKIWTCFPEITFTRSEPYWKTLLEIKIYQL